jgi:hypothetical protein
MLGGIDMQSFCYGLTAFLFCAAIIFGCQKIKNLARRAARREGHKTCSGKENEGVWFIMPKKIILFFLTAALLSILTGCDGNTASFVDQSSDTTSALQDAFDTSVMAEAYTNELFASMLSKEGISQYEILLTTGGFITSDPLVYISGYQYSYDGKKEVYGYKLQLNDDGSTFTVLEEGVEIGEFVCLSESPSAEG